jgi:hypothetical protein
MELQLAPRRVSQSLYKSHAADALLLSAGLPDWDYKTNRLPCSLVDTVVKSHEAKKSSKFVMKLKGKAVTAEFAVSLGSQSLNMVVASSF